MPSLYTQTALGTCSASHGTAGARVRIVQYPVGVRFAPHAHEYGSITALLRGGVAEDSPTRPSFRARAGDCLLKPPGQPHENTFDPVGTVTLQIELLGARVLDRRDALADEAYGLRRGSQAARLMFALARQIRGLGCGETLEDLLADVFGALRSTRRERSSPLWMPRVLRAIHDGLEGPLRVADLARLGGVHAVHMTRTFQQVHGCGVTEYIRRTRVSRAADLLAHPGVTACRAALEAGFCDQAHLNRAFGMVWGITPGQYRRLLARA